MRRVFACLLLVSLPPAARAEEPEDGAVIKARVSAVLAGIKANDPDAAMAAWPKQAPGRAAFRAIAESLSPPRDLTLTTTDPEYSRWKVGPRELRVRVRFVLVWKGKDAKDVNREVYAWNARFVKIAADWQWAECTEAVADVVAAISRAGTGDEAIRLVRDNPDLLPARLFAVSLIQKFEVALQEGRLEAAKFIHQALGEAAAAGKDPAAGAWTDYAFGRVLVLAGDPARAAAAFDMALARFLKLGDRPTALTIYSHLTEALILAGKLDEALKHADAAVELAGAVDQPDRLAAALHNRALAYRALGRFAAAGKDLRAALKIARERKDLAQESATLLGLGDVERNAGNLAAATEALRAALTIAAGTGDQRIEAYALSTLALIALDEARYDDARAGFRKALSLFAVLGEHRMVPAAVNGLGMASLARGAADDALNEFRRALALAEKLGSVPDAIVALTNIAVAEQRRGKHADALVAGTAALDAARKAGDRPNQAKAHLNLGGLYAALGQFDLAEEHWQSARELARTTGDRVTAAKALGNLGLCYLAVRNFPRARAAFLDCQKVAREAGQFSSEVIAASNLAYLANKEGNGEEAVRALRELLARVEKTGGGPDVERLRFRIAQILLSDGRSEDAGREFADLLTRASAAGNPSDLFEARLGLGEVARAGKKWSEAAAHYRAAIEAAERIRRDTREPELQVSHFQRFANPSGSNPYTGLAQCLAEQNDAAGAFATSERAKGRALAEILRTDRNQVTRGLTAQERERERELARAVAERTNVLEAVARRADPDAVENASRALESARTDLAAHRRFLYLRHPDLQTARAEFAPATLRELGATLFRDRPGLVVLSYLVAADRTFLFVLTAGKDNGDPARLAVHTIRVGGDDLGRAVEEFTAGCAKPALIPTSDDLVKWLLEPAKETVRGAKELIVVPDRSLHRLPFHALADRWDGEDETYLIQRCPVSYAPSVTALVKMTELADRRRAERRGSGAMLAVGITDFGPRARLLPAAEPEARAVEALFKKDAARAMLTLLGPKATKANVRAGWAGRRYLHFATHGEINWAAPLFSSILLSPDGTDEGRLYARDLLDADLTAELAVLSACRTGLGRVVGGEGVLGMSWGWFVAGVPSLVVSQWNVSDASTARLMGEFYCELLGGATKAEALRRAQLTLLRNPATRNPFHWASFVLLGDAGK